MIILFLSTDMQCSSSFDAGCTVLCEFCGKELITPHGLARLVSLDPHHQSEIDFLESLPFACDCPQALALADRLEADNMRRAREKKQKARELKLHRLFLASGMPLAFENRSLKLWIRNSPEQVRAYEAVADYGKHLLDGSKHVARSLYVAGSVGSGKTFLVSCLARDLQRRSAPILWANMGKILSELKSCFAKNLDPEEVLKLYKNAELLIIDDLGKERPTEWATEQLFYLVNFRYENNLPIIITTNYGAKALIKRLTPPPPFDDPTTATAIVDRLCEICTTITLTGKSHRQQQNN